jgi:hypothetical protein
MLGTLVEFYNQLNSNRKLYEILTSGKVMSQFLRTLRYKIRLKGQDHTTSSYRFQNVKGTEEAHWVMHYRGYIPLKTEGVGKWFYTC